MRDRRAISVSGSCVEFRIERTYFQSSEFHLSDRMPSPRPAGAAPRARRRPRARHGTASKMRTRAKVVDSATALCWVLVHTPGTLAQRAPPASLPPAPTRPARSQLKLAQTDAEPAGRPRPIRSPQPAAAHCHQHRGTESSGASTKCGREPQPLCDSIWWGPRPAAGSQSREAGSSFERRFERAARSPRRGQWSHIEPRPPSSITRCASSRIHPPDLAPTTLIRLPRFDHAEASDRPLRRGPPATTSGAYQDTGGSAMLCSA